MKKVFEHIGRRSKQFERLPLFEFLRERSVDPAERLRFIPGMTHFVMAFADLYNFVLPENPPTDRYHALVNAHLGEDSEHWKWFLVDLANANLDRELRFTDAVRYIFSDATVQTRLLSYRICQLSGRVKSSLEKLIMVNCIEATGKVGLEALAVAGGDLESQLGKKLVYFGRHHVETETKHTLEDTQVRASIEAVVLSDEERRSADVLIDKTFDLFENSVLEMYRLAKSGRELGPDALQQRDHGGPSTLHHS